MKKLILLPLVSLFVSISTSWQPFIAQQSGSTQTTDAEQRFQDAVIERMSNGFRDPDDIVIRRLNVSSDEAYALASWNYVEMGGITILHQKNDEIEVLTHGGGALRQEDLVNMGIPVETAVELLQEDEE